jgi:hypothetical protein
MQCAEPTKPHRKSGMWGTQNSLTSQNTILLVHRQGKRLRMSGRRGSGCSDRDVISAGLGLWLRAVGRCSATGQGQREEEKQGPPRFAGQPKPKQRKRRDQGQHQSRRCGHRPAASGCTHRHLRILRRAPGHRSGSETTTPAARQPGARKRQRSTKSILRSNRDRQRTRCAL